MLNYAYAVLEAQVRMHIIAEGYDPNIGYLHTSRPDRPGLVFDLMEPMRPIVDRAVLRFVQSHTFHPADFTIRSDGVCRLNPEMARSVTKMIAAKSVNASLTKDFLSSAGTVRPASHHATQLSSQTPSRSGLILAKLMIDIANGELEDRESPRPSKLLWPKSRTDGEGSEAGFVSCADRPKRWQAS
jgi:hypothetical protein